MSTIDIRTNVPFLRHAPWNVRYSLRPKNQLTMEYLVQH